MVYWEDNLSTTRPINRLARSGAVLTVTSLKGPLACVVPFVDGDAIVKIPSVAYKRKETMLL